MHTTEIAEDVETVETPETTRKGRVLRLLMIGAGVGLVATAGTLAFDQFTASASASTLPPEPAAAAAQSGTIVEVELPTLSDEEIVALEIARAEAEALLASSEGRVVDNATREHLSGLVTRAAELSARVDAGTATADEITELAGIVEQIRAAMSGVEGSVAQAEAAFAEGGDVGAAADYYYGSGDAGYYEGGDAGYYDGGDAGYYEGSSGGGGFSTGAYCYGPECAQSAVDSADLAYVDYGTGYRAYSGHNYGPAGEFASYGVGDSVSIDGNNYRVTSTQIVGPNATTADVQAGLAVQTCLEDGNMVVHYIEQY